MNQVQMNLDDLSAENHQNKSIFMRLLYKEFAWPWKLLEIVEFFVLGISGIVHCVVFSTHLD